VLLIGALFGLAISGAVLTLLWFGVAGVLHANATGTDWMHVFWPASVMLVVGWRSTIPGLMITVSAVAIKVADRQEVSETFAVHAVQADPAQLEADYAPLVADLQSRDLLKHELAVGAITQHPQEFLEPMILKLSEDTQTMGASITGLKKLGTDRAKRRLAELTAPEYGEYVRQPATTAVAELGDPSYCGLMLQLVSLRQGYTSEIAVRGAGLLCGDKAIPQLVSLLRKPSTFPVYEIAYALGNTGSRSAVPILIELLSNTDTDVRRAAKDALYTLTHRQSKSDNSAADHQNWIRWWALQGKTAQIFDPAECP